MVIRWMNRCHVQTSSWSSFSSGFFGLNKFKRGETVSYHLPSSSCYASSSSISSWSSPTTTTTTNHYNHNNNYNNYIYLAHRNHMTRKHSHGCSSSSSSSSSSSTHKHSQHSASSGHSWNPLAHTSDSERSLTLHDSSQEGLAARCEQVTRWGIYGNIGLCGVKAVAGYATNSYSLLADAIHSLTDLISDGLTLITIRYSRQKPTENFPFGYGKLDTFGSIGSSVILALGSYHIITHSCMAIYRLLRTDKLHMIAESVTSPHHHDHLSMIASAVTDPSHVGVHIGTESGIVSMPNVALTCVVASLFIKEWLYRITLKAGQEYHSKVTITNAWHHRSDAWSGFAALIGVGGAALGYPIFDPLCALGVGAILAKISFDFGKEGVLELMDQSVTGETREELAKQIMLVKGVEGIHCLSIRASGPYLHVIGSVYLDKSLSVERAAKISDDVKTKLLKEYDAIQHIVITSQPKKAED